MWPENVKVRAAVTQDYPEAILPSCFMRLPKGKCKKPGYDIEVFDSIMKLLKWDYEFKLSWKKMDYGYQKEDGSWSGLLGMVHRNEADCSGLRLKGV